MICVSFFQFFLKEFMSKNQPASKYKRNQIVINLQVIHFVRQKFVSIP